MIKNLNDILSLFVLACFLVLGIRLFIWAFISNAREAINPDEDSKISLFFNYNDNEEE